MCTYFVQIVYKLHTSCVNVHFERIFATLTHVAYRASDDNCMNENGLVISRSYWKIHMRDTSPIIKHSVNLYRHFSIKFQLIKPLNFDGFNKHTLLLIFHSTIFLVSSLLAMDWDMFLRLMFLSVLFWLVSPVLDFVKNPGR